MYSSSFYLSMFVLVLFCFFSFHVTLLGSCSSMCHSFCLCLCLCLCFSISTSIVSVSVGVSVFLFYVFGFVSLSSVFFRTLFFCVCFFKCLSICMSIVVLKLVCLSFYVFLFVVLCFCCSVILNLEHMLCLSFFMSFYLSFFFLQLFLFLCLLKTIFGAKINGWIVATAVFKLYKFFPPFFEEQRVSYKLKSS
jgi:hypothetical protein